MPRATRHEWLLALNLISIGLVGWLDYTTGTAISFSVFYIPPVALTAWWGGRLAGVLASLLAAVTWFAADVASAGVVVHPMIHCWNAAMRFITYAAVTVLVDLARLRRDVLEKAVEQKTALLQREIQERARVEREVVNICSREQRRIAYDLHDRLGQHLVGVALRAKILAQQLSGPYAAEASAVVQLLNDAARQVRSLARNLDGAEGIGDLRAALDKLATEVNENCHIASTLKAGDTCLPVSTPVAVQLYRIAQEAVHNAVEHGNARTVDIDLLTDPKQIVLTVRDDGRGFDKQKVSPGMGLRIMRYRAQCVGGLIDIDSKPGSTAVTCRVPQSAAGIAEE